MGLCAAMVSLMALVAMGSARAQQPPSQSGAEPPADVAALFVAIADIDILRLINPVKLTPDQAGKLATTITEAQKTYTKNLADAVGPGLRKLADEINATRKKVVAGEPIPADFDARIKAADAAYQKDRDRINLENFKSLIASTRKILTDRQLGTAAELMRKNNPDKDPNADPEKWYNAYVLEVFINYPRIVPLLNEIKKALPPASTASPGSAAPESK
jgi:hypothetical protein